MTRLPIVGVMGSGSAEHHERADPLGRWLAGRGVHLLTGGGGGVMTSVSRAFHEVPGRAGLVIGVLPSHEGRPPPEYPNPWVEVPILTHLPLSGTRGTEAGSRNHINVLSSEVIVALPGGAGTASEVRLALAYDRPIVAYLERRDEIPDLPARVPVESSLAAIQAFIQAAIAGDSRGGSDDLPQAGSALARLGRGRRRKRADRARRAGAHLPGRESMKHRHLDYDPTAPLEAWPAAALVDLLERGDLDDWRPLAAAVTRDPDGPLAERLARLVDVYPMYGTSPLWRAFLQRCRVRARATAAGTGSQSLGSLRRTRGLTQAEVGQRLGLSQSDVSKLERRRDLRLSTLRAYASALGGRLRLMFSADAGEVEIDAGHER